MVQQPVEMGKASTRNVVAHLDAEAVPPLTFVPSILVTAAAGRAGDDKRGGRAGLALTENTVIPATSSLLALLSGGWLLDVRAPIWVLWAAVGIGVLVLVVLGLTQAFRREK